MILKGEISLEQVFHLCLYAENHMLDTWFKKAYGDEAEIKTSFHYNKIAVCNCKNNEKKVRIMSITDIHSLSHTKWNYKYHIVFAAAKYRREIFYYEKKEAVGKILRQLCEWEGVNIDKAEVCPDHIHMLLEIPPKTSVSSFMGYLKWKSSTMLYEQFSELKYKYSNREF